MKRATYKPDRAPVVSGFAFPLVIEPRIMRFLPAFQVDMVRKTAALFVPTPDGSAISQPVVVLRSDLTLAPGETW